jgi:GNAT superfamily N-acetyltransferase
MTGGMHELSAELSGVEPLTKDHDVSAFRCGKSSLDDWLARFALINQPSDSARTYVVHRARKVVGYYSLSAGSVRKDEAPPRAARGLASHPIGIILLARLAVASSEQGKRLGQGLLRDALARSAGAAEIIGARAVLVHAIDEEAAAFYATFGFEPSPVNPRHLMLIMKAIRAALRLKP